MKLLLECKSIPAYTGAKSSQHLAGKLEIVAREKHADQAERIFDGLARELALAMALMRETRDSPKNEA